MGDNVKLSKWGVGVLVGMASLVLAVSIQTALAFKWAGQVSERLDNLSTAVNTTKSDLTRRIERIEDRSDRQK